MNGGVNIIADNFFADQNSVLVVVAFPCHKTDQCVFAQADFAVLGCGAVGNDRTGLHPLVYINNRDLIDTCSLIGPHKLSNMININIAVVTGHPDFVRAHAAYDAGMFGNDADAGVNAGLVLHSRADNRGLRFQKRNSLPLHVGTHEGTVGVIVFKERNHRSRNGNNHSWRNIHKISFFTFNFKEFITVAGIDLGMLETPLLVKRFIRLRYNIIIFNIRRHIDNFAGNTAGFFVHAAEGRFNKTVFIDLGKSCQIGNQSDVRAFRCFNRAHAAVVAVVNVADLEARAVS